MTSNLYTRIETGPGLPNIYQPLGLFLDNDYTPSSNSDKYDSINPST